MTDRRASAVIVVDVQNDFCPGGALGVRDGDRVIAPLNKLMQWAEQQDHLIYVTRDWHAPDASHFKDYGGIWPVHCVQGTSGAAFHSQLHPPASATVVDKGDQPGRDGYSAFEGHTSTGEALVHDLREKDVNHIYIGGLATDYCVRHSVLDALKSGFQVTVLTNAIAGVDLEPGDSARALDEMRLAGAHFATTDEVVRG